MNRQHGFSLIELLVVVTVIAILASMLLAGVGVVRRQAKALACATNLRQIGMAFLAYAEDCDGTVPNVAILTGATPDLRWSELLAPYVETRLNAAGEVDLTGGRSVLTGCPQWRVTQVWKLGYGMNQNLRRTSALLYPDYYQTNRLDTRVVPPNPLVVRFHWAQLTHLAGRLLITETTDYHTVGVIDPTRHGTRLNALFSDQHVQSLAGLPPALQGINAPDLGPP